MVAVTINLMHDIFVGSISNVQCIVSENMTPLI